MAGWTNDGNGGRIGKAAILELTLDAMEQGISVVDADLNVVVFNRRFLDILGLPTGRFQPGDPFEAFVRFNAERGDYGPGMFAAFGGKYFETECNQNGDPVVAYDASTGKADKWSLRNMREFMRARTAAVEHVHGEETSDGKRG